MLQTWVSSLFCYWPPSPRARDGAAVMAYDRMVAFVPASPPGMHYCGLGISMVLAYFVYGFSLILIAPLLNLLLGGRLSAWRGPQVSLGAMRWYVHCTMTLLRGCPSSSSSAPPCSELVLPLMG